MNSWANANDGLAALMLGIHATLNNTGQTTLQVPVYSWDEHATLGPVWIRVVIGRNDEWLLVRDLDGKRHIVAKAEVYEVEKAHLPAWATPDRCCLQRVA